MDFNQIIKFFISASLITTGIVYLAKIIIDRIADLRIEKYKNSLEKKNEAFRNSLNAETEKFRN